MCRKLLREAEILHAEVLESAGEGRGVEGHLLAPTHSQDPSRGGDNGETLPAVARRDTD